MTWRPWTPHIIPMDPREQAALDELRRRGAFDRYYLNERKERG